jgi:hypothetical protein
MTFKPSYGKFVANVKELIQSAIERKQRINALRKDQLEKLAAAYEIKNQNLTKELVELAVVELARELSHRPGTIRQRFESIVELYSYQGNLSHRTSHSMLLQQYSTPAPIAYLMGVFCGIDKSGHNPLAELRGRFFEPSAGNGMLTIASDTQSFIVNDIDEVRNANLHQQNYYQTLAFDGTKDWTQFLNYDAIFDAVITNPPFGKLPEARIFDGFKITELDHLMSIRALDTMKDSGRAAIIIGGNTTWDEHGRIQAGKNRMFFSYLHKHYNVVDVLNIDGTLYSRMGTSFDVRVILIAGRKPVPGGYPPLYSKTQDATIHDFDSYYKRIEKYIGSGNAESLQNEMKNNPAVIDIIKHHSPFGISKVVASYLKNGNTPEFKNDFNRVYENPNYNTKEKFEKGIDEFKRDKKDKIENIEKDLKKLVETGGESMKNQPHYKNQLAIIQGNKHIIEIADNLTDILFTQNNSETLELELEAESVAVELELLSLDFDFNNGIDSETAIEQALLTRNIVKRILSFQVDDKVILAKDLNAKPVTIESINYQQNEVRVKSGTSKFDHSGNVVAIKASDKDKLNGIKPAYLNVFLLMPPRWGSKAVAYEVFPQKPEIIQAYWELSNLILSQYKVGDKVTYLQRKVELTKKLEENGNTYFEGVYLDEPPSFAHYTDKQRKGDQLVISGLAADALIVEDGLDFITTAKVPGITHIETEDNGNTLIYGTKTSKTRLTTAGLTKEEISEELSFEKMSLENNKKDLPKLEREKENIRATKGTLSKDWADNEKAIKDTNKLIEVKEKITIPFLELKLLSFSSLKGLDHPDNLAFNKEILLIKKRGIKDKILKLGYPSKLLLENGVENLIIELDTEKIFPKTMKLKGGKHWLRVDDFINLPENIKEPVAIFRASGVRKNSRVILTTLRDYLKRRVVVILRIEKVGKRLVINIPSIYGKNTKKQLKYWEKTGLLLWKDNKKWLEVLR